MRPIKFRIRFEEFKGNAISNSPFCYYDFYELISNTERFPYKYRILSKDQFTGLLDKNGKEIYEGDIVKHNHGYTDKRDVIAVVKFGEYPDDEGYSTNTHLGWYLDEIKHDNQHSLIDLHEQIEIIGNIDKNPELVEVK